MRGATRGCVQFEGALFGRFAERRLGVGCREGLEEGLVGAGNAVEELVARGPEGV